MLHVARGGDPLDCKNCVELLLSACSTFDKKVVLPASGQDKTCCICIRDRY